jgi:hypothetical protein
MARVVWSIAGVANVNGTGEYTKNVVISDNNIVGGIESWTIALSPQNNNYDERIRDVIVERNYFTAGAGTQIQIDVAATNVTIRNNILNLTGGSQYQTGINVQQRGVEPVPDNTLIYNNTIYTTGASNSFYPIAITSTSLTTTVKNNLISGGTSGGTAVTHGTGTTLVSSNNLVNNTAAALFVNSTPTLPSHFALKAGSPAINYGASIPVWEDYIKATRTTWDAGAYKY